MQVYNLLVTLEVSPEYEYDEAMMTSKVLVVTKKYFDVVKTCMHSFVEGAFTFAVILAESHLVMQTYPELNRIYISIEFHEEDVRNRKIQDDHLVEELVANLGGTLIGSEKRER